MCNHQADSPLYVWPNVWSGDLQVLKIMVIHDTECPYRDQVSFNNTNLVLQGEKRESLVTLVYCDMRGYDVSFAHIHAMKLAHQGTLRGKRIGNILGSVYSGIFKCI